MFQLLTKPNPESKTSTLENLRILNATIQKDSEIFSLTASITETRKRMDTLIKSEGERLKLLERARREEKKRLASEARLAEQATAEKIAKEAVLEKTAVQEQAEKPVAVEVSKAPIQPSVETTKVEAVVPSATVDKVVASKAPSVPSTPTPVVATQEKKPPLTPGNGVGQKPGEAIRTFTPSYIKGRISPSAASAIAARSQPPQRGAGANRPAGGTYPPRPGMAGRPSANPAPLRPGTATPPPSTPTRKVFTDKPVRKEYRPGDDRSKGMNKRTLIRKGFIDQGFDDERMGVRKLKNKRKVAHLAPSAIVIEKAIITTENLTVKILSEKIGKTAQEIIKKLMVLGIMTTINSVVDFATMELVASELGVELELKLDKTQEALLEEGHDIVDTETDLVKRPPIITVMGHVDHGKTSLLDRLRKTNVVAGEAGGITQGIGAYTVSVKGEKITFLDTPGHEAFTHMRARGAKVTDIVVLVVAADDGIMPQTIEAINHAKAADVPILVAVNKIDKPGANVAKVREMLTEYGLVAEEWGGDTIIVPISAKQGENIDKLLESILLLAEVHNFRANPKRLARASVIEAKVDKGRGPVANVMILNGTLRVGDTVVAGTSVARVRAMTDDRGRSVKEVGPSTPVSILGFSEVPNAGDTVLAVDDEKVARQVAQERVDKFKNEQASSAQKLTLDDLLQKTGTVKLRDLNVIIKADVKGAAEALKDSLAKMANEEAKVNVVHSGVGGITKSDIMLAEVSKAIIVGFNVRPDNESKALAEAASIDIRTYKIIYEAIEDIQRMLKGMLTPKYKENITGRAEVRNVFKITGSGIVAGSYVTNGKIYRNAKVRIFRGEEVVFEGSIRGLKRFKEDVKDVAEGYECGISIDGFSELKELDIIESYQLEQIMV